MTRKIPHLIRKSSNLVGKDQGEAYYRLIYQSDMDFY